MPNINQTEAMFPICEFNRDELSKGSLEAAESFALVGNFTEQVMCRCCGESFKETVSSGGSNREGDLTCKVSGTDESGQMRGVLGLAFCASAAQRGDRNQFNLSFR